MVEAPKDQHLFFLEPIGIKAGHTGGNSHSSIEKWEAQGLERGRLEGWTVKITEVRNFWRVGNALQMGSSCCFHMFCFPKLCPRFCLSPGSWGRDRLCSDGACSSCSRHWGRPPGRVEMAFMSETEKRKITAKLPWLQRTAGRMQQMKNFKENERTTQMSILRDFYFWLLSGLKWKKKKKQHHLKTNNDNGHCHYVLGFPLASQKKIYFLFYWWVFCI